MPADNLHPVRPSPLLGYKDFLGVYNSTLQLLGVRTLLSSFHHSIMSFSSTADPTSYDLIFAGGEQHATFL